MLEKIKTNWTNLSSKRKKSSSIILLIACSVMVILLISIFNSVISLMELTNGSLIVIYVGLAILLFCLILALGLTKLNKKKK